MLTNTGNGMLHDRSLVGNVIPKMKLAVTIQKGKVFFHNPPVDKRPHEPLHELSMIINAGPRTHTYLKRSYFTYHTFQRKYCAPHEIHFHDAQSEIAEYENASCGFESLSTDLRGI